MLNKILFFILFTVLLTDSSFCQKNSIDSLQNILKTEVNDTSKIITLNSLGSIFHDKTEYDIALQYINKAKELAKKINYKHGLAISYKLTGYVLTKKGEFTNALDTIDKAIEIQKTLGNKIDIGAGYNFKGNIYLMKGDYKEALHYLLQGLKILEETKNRKGIGMAYNGIGIAYYSQHNYDKAIEAFKKSLSFKDSIKDKLGLAVGYNNIGIIYLEQHKYEDALDYYTKSLKLRLEIDDKQGIADTYDNLGVVHYELKNYEEAINYHFKALEISKELKHLNVILHSYLNIGKVYLKQDKLNEANKYFYYALDLGKKLEDKSFMRDVYRQLAELNYLKKQYKEAYDYYAIYSMYNEKLFDIQSNKQMAEMNTKYESEKKDRELLKLNKDNEVKQAELKRKEIEKRNLLIIVVASIIIVLILILLGAFLKKSNTKMKNINSILIKQSQEIERKNKEINTQAVQIARYQSQMNPHFIFNAINGLQSMVLEEDKFKAIGQIQSLSKLLRLTLNNSESEYITIQEEENYLNKYVEFELLRFKKKFTFTFSVDEGIDKCLRIPTMIIQPIIENAIKHAGLNEINNGEIKVSLSKHKNYKGNLLKIEITDNGTGVKMNATNLESKGLKITKQRLLLEFKKNNIYFEDYFSIKNRIYDENDIINGTRVWVVCPCYTS